jgi:hypothetical protein
LTTWLRASSSHRLVVLAGQVTAGDRFYSVKHYLLDAVRTDSHQSIRKQVVVCPYPHVNHEDIWIDFKAKMRDPAITVNTCPTAKGVSRPAGWNP